MTCTCNPTMTYAAWCEALGRIAAKTGKRVAFGDGTFSAWRDGKTPEAYAATLPHTSDPRKKNPRRNGSSADDFPWDPPPTPDATNANVNYAGRSRVWAWRDRSLPIHRVYVKEPGYLKYDLDVKYVEIGPPIRMVKARVTEVAKDGAKWGWPGERVVRYEAEDGSWAWVPGDEKIGDTFEIEAAPAREAEVNPWSASDVVRETIVDNMARTIWRIVAAGADPARKVAHAPPAAHRAAQDLADVVERLNDESLVEMGHREIGGGTIAAVAARGNVRGRRARGDELEVDGVVVPHMDVKGTADHTLTWTITHDGREIAHGTSPLPAADTGYLRANPSGDDERDAVDKYEEFHRYAPKHIDVLEIAIPTRVRELGAAKHVLYRSGKVDPSTLKKPKRPVDYIHEHDAGVTIYACDGMSDTDVPEDFTEIGALTVLGKCLGFALKDGTEAEGIAPLPDLCCTPDGKCLMVVQDRKKVLFMIWGGALGVFARGIDG